MRRSRLVIALSLTAVLAACGVDASPAGAPADVPDAVAEPDAQPDTVAEPHAEPDELDDPTDGLDPSDGELGEVEELEIDLVVRIDGSTLEIRDDARDGVRVHGWTLEGETFHTYLVRPDAPAGSLDVVALALAGERPVLYHVSARPDGAAVLAAFPDHLQPAHVVDASPPAFGWTPDARSLVWTETTGEDLVLRTVGWEDGPGTGRPADDNASFVLDLPADAHLDGFEVTEDGRWILLLRDGTGGLHEVAMERQADGALAIPAT
jgi:hypothetical protein